jgi:hypothetical protein
MIPLAHPIFYYIKFNIINIKIFNGFLAPSLWKSIKRGLKIH